MADLVEIEEIRGLKKRGIRQETCEKFGYGVGRYGGKLVQVAPYRDQHGVIVAQKIRTPDKEFSTTGTIKGVQLWGQHLWQKGGKRLIVTEGEIDALSMSQAQGNKWPVVSIVQGAGSARKSLADNLEWVCSFDEVVICFDQDDPGQKAAREAALLLPPGKGKIAHLPLNDVNDMLLASRADELMKAIYQAEEYRPDGMVSLQDVFEQVLRPVVKGIPWPWPSLTEFTYGRRPGEVYMLGAGTGVGKTDVFTQIICHDLVQLNEQVGIFYLEQTPAETVRRIAGKISGKRFHIPGADWTPDDLARDLTVLQRHGKMHLYDNFGCTDWDVVKSHIRYLAAAGCRNIYLDHLTALAAGHENERETLELVMAEMAMLAKELGLIFHCISHLATPEGKPHEEGGRVMIRHFKGSRAIGFWSHFMFGMERNQQAKEEDDRHTTTFRVLKDRYTGNSTGRTFGLVYDQDTGLLLERDQEPECAFEEEKGEF